jgi:hypothetical protein
MTIGDLSIFCSLKLFSSMVYSFPCRDLSHPVYSYMGFFEAIVNGVIFLYSFSFYLYRKATDFHKLILCPATLLKVFMMSRGTLLEFSRSFRYKMMSSANSDSLTSSFLT